MHWLRWTWFRLPVVIRTQGSEISKAGKGSKSVHSGASDVDG